MSQTSSSIKALQKNNNGSIDVDPKDQQPPIQKPKYVPILHQPQIPIQQQQLQQQQQYGSMHQQPQPNQLQQQQMQPIQQGNYVPIQQQQQGLRQQQRMPMHQQEQVKDKDIPIFECYPQQSVQPPTTAVIADENGNGNNSGNTKMKIFNQNDEKYHCCCGCCHSKSGTKAIAYWEVLVVIALVTVSCMFGFNNHGDFYTIGEAARYGFAAVCEGIGVVFLIIALCKKNHKLLLPYFGCQIIKLVGLLGYSIYLICYIVKQNNERYKKQAENMNGKNYVDMINGKNNEGANVLVAQPYHQVTNPIIQ